MSTSSSTQGLQAEEAHVTQTTFPCAHCTKTFSRIENLKRHIASHDDIGRYRCPICQKHFSRSDLLKRHQKNHGKDKSRANSIKSTAARTKDVSIHETSPLKDLVSNPQNVPSFESHLPPPPVTEGPRMVDLSRPNDFRADVSLESAPHAIQEGHSNFLWDGFMAYDDLSGLNLGSFDGDIAWTLDFAHSHPSVESFSDDLFAPSSADFTGLSNLPVDGTQGNAVEVEEDEATEWPDRISRPASPLRPTVRRTYQNPQYWRSIVAEAQVAKAELQLEQGHLYTGSVDSAIRNNLLFLLEVPSSIDAKSGEIHEGAFPPTEILDFFLLLYFRHVHRRFPVIHLPTFNPLKTAPVLLIAMLLVGSSHSRSNRGWFAKLFYKRSRMALMRKQESDSKFLRSVDNIFALLLICVAGTWSGGRESYEFAEGVRGVLVTASRRCRLLDCRPNMGENSSHLGGRMLDHIWVAWIETEKRKRLGLAIYLFDCQYPALFNNQPYISKAETANSVFPCPREYWEATTSDSWKMLIGPADMPPSTYYLHALNCCLLRKREVLPPMAKTDIFGKTVLIYALHTHIFEWRQAVSMLNPNGLANAYGNFVFEIGYGLRDRRNWLLDSLTNWYECYGTVDIDVAGSLLYHLAFVSIYVSLSDLHLAAGRSGSRGEGEIAERSLEHWANSDIADETMSHVDKMLEISHAALASGEAFGSSFEVAMSFFTGGLVYWAYAKHRADGPHSHSDPADQILRASKALREMGCWQMCSLFGAILKGFEGV